ncbi:DUF1343 domain-containing protein [Flavihumibacter rivuli]|uniref:exo-beta-N-acetylmuramidase NamZ family protein n=1 Tax=Flavihumibacter rivuli TaxID=2838156 RepID=UPI001BDDCB07|nr:DUF1343 domain-containing protein [Flavihumibacter rivuli]ULQ56215.1 DUF1343 domain-containing protein [Flavihumibacter rivuli]
MTPLFGIDQWLRREADDRRWGLVTNNAATTITGILSRTALLSAGWKVSLLFSPEHGLTAQGADGERQPDLRDPVTGLPVTSLYGNQWAPSPEQLEQLDGILFDIPDVGSRFYTYLWTLTHVMEVCAAARKELVILDRPNPIGQDLDLAEGPLLDEQHCSSFIGRWSIPIRHCCSLGELGSFFAATRVKGLNLTIIPHNINDTLPLTDLSNWPFIPPSPAITDPVTALLYPGTCLFEGINVSEGRGTTLPFRIIGAPFINSTELANAINGLTLPGTQCIPYSFRPEWGLYAKEWCEGVQWIVTDATAFRPVNTMVQTIRVLHNLYPGLLKERPYPTHANPTGLSHLERLVGVPYAFEKIIKGELNIVVGEEWKKKIEAFR